MLLYLYIRVRTYNVYLHCFLKKKKSLILGSYDRNDVSFLCSFHFCGCLEDFLCKILCFLILSVLHNGQIFPKDIVNFWFKRPVVKPQNLRKAPKVWQRQHFIYLKIISMLKYLSKKQHMKFNKLSTKAVRTTIFCPNPVTDLNQFKFKYLHL